MGRLLLGYWQLRRHLMGRRANRLPIKRGWIGLVTLLFRCGVSLLGCLCFESQWADAAEV